MARRDYRLQHPLVPPALSKMKKGFTLIELLVVISIIGILIGMSLIGMKGARQSARDSQRKADLAAIVGGLELYKADCNLYPASLGTSLVGSGVCAGNTYMASVPKDPLDPARTYVYTRTSTVTYTLCASLEKEAGDCNYTLTNP